MKKFFVLCLMGMGIFSSKYCFGASLKKVTFEVSELSGFTVKTSSTCVWEDNFVNAFKFLGKTLDYFYKILPEELAYIIKDYPIYILDNKDQPMVSFVLHEEGIQDENLIVINDLLKFYKKSFTDLGSPLLGILAEKYYRIQLNKDMQEHVAETFLKSKSLYTKVPSIKDAISYFVNLTTAYWGINYVTPIDYHALMSYDPRGFSLMEEIWGERPLKNFVCVYIEGFRIMYPVSSQNDKCMIAALTELKNDLAHIVTYVPEKYVNLFRRKILWLENNSDGAACYHDSVEWLLSNGYIRDKSRCVEINNTEHFIQWSEVVQPMMVLHEYAHMYHFSSFSDSEEISSVYTHAMENHLYDEVDYFNGRENVKRTAYATNNQYEYFSELTEAYFGKNDFYPFNKADLKEHDPEGFRLMEKIWNEENFHE